MGELDRWITVPEAARRLGLTPGRVYQMVREDEIPGAFRVGKRALRIDRAEFDAWLEERRVALRHLLRAR